VTNRKQYRTPPIRGIKVNVALLGPNDTLHHGTILDASAGGMRLMLSGNHPDDVALGTVYQVRLTSKAFRQSIHTPAMIVHAEHDDGELLLGLRFLDWMGLKAMVPASVAPLFNLRQDPRLVLDPSMPVEVIVRGVTEVFELRGTVLDVSRSGMSFSASLLSQCALGRADQCSLEFTPPGIERCFRFGANIRNRSLQGESLRYGVWFERDLTEGFVLLQEDLAQYVDARLEAAMRDLVSM
jgi:hypothetical protein